MGAGGEEGTKTQRSSPSYKGIFRGVEAMAERSAHRQFEGMRGFGNMSLRGYALVLDDVMTISVRDVLGILCASDPPYRILCRASHAYTVQHNGHQAPTKQDDKRNNAVAIARSILGGVCSARTAVIVNRPNDTENDAKTTC